MIENLVLSNLILNEDYARKVIPYIKADYFEENSQRKLFDTVQEYISKYNALPTKEALIVSLDDRKDLNEKDYHEVVELAERIKIDDDTNSQWLLDQTEKFCQDRAVYNAIRRSIGIMDGEKGQDDKGVIPQILQEALSISFDTHIGHDYIEDAEERFDSYHRLEEKMCFDIELLNKITKGGVERKTMTVLIATSGGGKSLAMCHFAATHFMHGKNVLYITLEMAEKKISERIDANLLDITFDELKAMPKMAYLKRIRDIKSKMPGKILVKEYPTGAAHAGHFRHLLNELRIKKNFVPDVIFIDYLSICASSRIKNSGATNSYNLIKAVAEELRGLAVETNSSLVTAVQFNRNAYDNSDPNEKDVAESMGIVHTADLMLGLVSTDEFAELGQIMFKQIKNRYNDLNYYKRFMVGIDRSKMKLYDVDENAQKGLTGAGGDAPVMSSSSFGQRQEDDDNPLRNKFNKGKKWKSGGLG